MSSEEDPIGEGAYRSVVRPRGTEEFTRSFFRFTLGLVGLTVLLLRTWDSDDPDFARLSVAVDSSSDMDVSVSVSTSTSTLIVISR